MGNQKGLVPGFRDWLERFRERAGFFRWKAYLWTISLAIVSLACWIYFHRKPSYFGQEVSKAFFISFLIKLVLQEKWEKCCKKLIPSLMKFGVTNVFSSRRNLEYDDIQFLPNATGTIRIAGVTLKEFIDEENNNLVNVPPNGGKLYDLFLKIKENMRNQDNNIMLKLLLLDPYSQGAYLKGKAAGSPNIHRTIKENLDNFRKFFFGIDSDRIEIRICRTFPACQMVLTDHYALMQNSLLNPQIDDKGVEIPYMRYIKKNENELLFKYLVKHFNTLWEYDSIDIDELETNHSIGINLVLREMDVPNIYIPRGGEFDPKKRVIHLIKNTKKILWIKHVSFRWFLHYNHLDQDSLYLLLWNNGGQLYSKMHEIEDIRFLIINPSSIQAKMRSFREFRADNLHTEMTYKDFVSAKIWKRQVLFDHTQSSINEAIRLKSLEKAKKNLEGEEEKKPEYSNLSVRLYDSDPESACIITDSAVMFEPLNYGVHNPVQVAGGHSILSSRMPMMEFSFKDKGSGTYNVLKDNFEFAWNHFAKDIKPV